MCCKLWKGLLTKDGYPRGYYKGNRNVRYHRLVYCEANGLDLEEIDGMCVLHTCDVPMCVNPKHLYLGTVADNMRDRDRKDRHGMAKVPLPLAYQIVERLDNGENGYDLAKELNLSSSTIYYQRIRVRRIKSFVAS